MYCYCNVATKIARLKKNHFYVTQKIFRFLYFTNFLYSIFTLHIGSMLIFFVVVLETKKLFIHLSITLLIKKCFYYLGLIFNLCKTYVKALYFSKIASFHLATFEKINSVTGIFQGFYLDFRQHFQKIF